MYRQDAQNNLRYMQNQDSISIQSCLYYIPILKKLEKYNCYVKNNQKVHLFFVFHIKKTKYKKILIYKL